MSGEDRGERVDAGARSWWLYLFWFCQLIGLVGGSREHFRLPPVAMLVKLSPTKEATGLHTQQAQTRNQDLAAFETLHTKKAVEEREREKKTI